MHFGSKKNKKNQVVDPKLIVLSLKVIVFCHHIIMCKKLEYHIITKLLCLYIPFLRFLFSISRSLIFLRMFGSTPPALAAMLST